MFWGMLLYVQSHMPTCLSWKCYTHISCICVGLGICAPSTHLRWMALLRSLEQQSQLWNCKTIHDENFVLYSYMCYSTEQFWIQQMTSETIITFYHILNSLYVALLDSTIIYYTLSHSTMVLPIHHTLHTDNKIEWSVRMRHMHGYASIMSSQHKIE